MGMLSCSSSGTGTRRNTALKWLGFVTAVWVQSISGNNYTFSNYSDALKSLMSLNQVQLNNLSVAKDVGKAFGILAGLASDRIPTWLILLIGCLEGLLGYGVQWLVVSHTISPIPYWQMCVFLCMGGNSSTWMNTAVLVTCIRNFQKNRGPVSGVLKGYVGLSTAIFTDLCAALFSEDPSTILILLSVVPLVVCIAAMFFLREVPTAVTVADDKEETQFFGYINLIAVAVAVWLLLHDVMGPMSKSFSTVFAVVLIMLLASPIMIPGYAYIKSLKSGGSDVEGQVNEPLISENVALYTEREVVEALLPAEKVEVVELTRRKPVIGEEHTIFEALMTLDFWVLFISFLCGVGTGLTVMNNMGQMGSALGYADVSIFVSFTCIFGFFGRIISGSVSEYFMKKAGTPRPLWNGASQVLMAVGYIVMAMAMPGSLYIGTMVVGFCYGVRMAITVPTASELFGLKNYGLFYNILILNLPLGSFLFSGLLAGLLYDSQATQIDGGGNTCYGAHCFRAVFLVMAVACVVGFVLDIWLAIRTKSVYSKIQATKSKKSQEVSNGH